MFGVVVNIIARVAEPLTPEKQAQMVVDVRVQRAVPGFLGPVHCMCVPAWMRVRTYIYIYIYIYTHGHVDMVDM